MRQLVIMAGLALTACAAPGVSGVSNFMSAMHPTQEFCASRGMTLDSTTKQCVTPPQATPQQVQASESVTGSLPQPAPVQSKALSAPSQPPAQVPAPVAQSSAPAPAPPAQSAPQEHKQTAPTTPIEPDAVIHPGAQQNVSLSELVHYVRASGYRCDNISALQPLPSSHGYRLVCNRFSFKYAIEDKDNRLTVAVE